jgi:hypothetical protein
MMDAQFQRYRIILGTGCDESSWIFSNQVAEAVFAGTWGAYLLVLTLSVRHATLGGPYICGPPYIHIESYKVTSSWMLLFIWT